MDIRPFPFSLIAVNHINHVTAVFGEVLPDKGQETFVLAGILSFTDKVINEETRQYIKEGIGMTQVGLYFYSGFQTAFSIHGTSGGFHTH